MTWKTNISNKLDGFGLLAKGETVVLWKEPYAGLLSISQGLNWALTLCSPRRYHLLLSLYQFLDSMLETE